METTDLDEKTVPLTGLDAPSGGGAPSETGERYFPSPFRRPINGSVIALTVLLGAVVPAYADEPGALSAQRNATSAADVADLNYRRGLAVDAASIGDTEGVRFSGYVAPPSHCLCTNLNQVSIICEDCDNATDANQCANHDRACRDAAQAGGVREHMTFFCTTPE